MKQKDKIIELLDSEEAAFARTLDRGEKLFEEMAADAKANKTTTLKGDVCWKLYDTFGFPVDLTRLMAEEQNLTIDEEALKAAQELAKETSKKRKDAGGKTTIVLDIHTVDQLIKDGLRPTADDAKFGKLPFDIDTEMAVLTECPYSSRTSRYCASGGSENLHTKGARPKHRRLGSR